MQGAGHSGTVPRGPAAVIPILSNHNNSYFENTRGHVMLHLWWVQNNAKLSFDVNSELKFYLTLGCDLAIAR